jgi:hypothetical protein
MYNDKELADVGKPALLMLSIFGSVTNCSAVDFIVAMG